MTTHFQTALVDTARHLTAQLGRIERMHRAGVEPTFGDLQDLFETATMLARQLALAPAAADTCPVEACDQVATVRVAPGRTLCAGHARQVQDLLGTIRPVAVAGRGDSR